MYPYAVGLNAPAARVLEHMLNPSPGDAARIPVARRAGGGCPVALHHLTALREGSSLTNSVQLFS
jgi:hypothetical protein